MMNANELANRGSDLVDSLCRDLARVGGVRNRFVGRPAFYEHDAVLSSSPELNRANADLPSRFLPISAGTERFSNGSPPEGALCAGLTDRGPQFHYKRSKYGCKRLAGKVTFLLPEAGSSLYLVLFCART